VKIDHGMVLKELGQVRTIESDTIA
jgi:hypothetical protein